MASSKSTEDGAVEPTPAMRARLREMVGHHFDFIWRSVRRLGVRDGDVDDLVQRVFLTASRRLAEIRVGAERAFLFAVAVREAGHIRRSYRRRGETGEDAIAAKSTGNPRPDELAGRAEAMAFVNSIIDAMPEDLRVVFVLFEVEELSTTEIAELLDIPVGTAKSRLRRAREDFAARTATLREVTAP